MSLITIPARAASANYPTPLNPDRAAFARGALFTEFGYNTARAIEAAGFIDRLPHEAPLAPPTDTASTDFRAGDFPILARHW